MHGTTLVAKTSRCVQVVHGARGAYYYGAEIEYKGGGGEGGVVIGPAVVLGKFQTSRAGSVLV